MNRTGQGLKRGEECPFSLKFKASWLVCCLLILLSASVGFAQRNAEADRLLGEARAAAESARETYAGSIFNIDQPLWRRALDLGQTSLAASPQRPRNHAVFGADLRRR